MTESNSWITDDQFTELEKYDKEWAKMLRDGKFNTDSRLGYTRRSRHISDYGSCVVGRVLGKTDAEYSTDYNCIACADYSNSLFECWKRGAKNEFSAFLAGFLNHVGIEHNTKAKKRLAP